MCVHHTCCTHTASGAITHGARTYLYHVPHICHHIHACSQTHVHATHITHYPPHRCVCTLKAKHTTHMPSKHVDTCVSHKTCPCIPHMYICDMQHTYTHIHTLYIHHTQGHHILYLSIYTPHTHTYSIRHSYAVGCRL
jgi:hypothetical protein